LQREAGGRSDADGPEELSENPIFIESYKSVILGIFFEDLSYEQDYCKEFSSLIKGT
jgi:hypothetical protein